MNSKFSYIIVAMKNKNRRLWILEISVYFCILLSLYVILLININILIGIENYFLINKIYTFL